MPNSRSVYNFVKLEIGKALRDTGGASGPGQQPLTLSLPHPVTLTSDSATPNWGASYLAGRLGAGAVLSRRRVGMRQVAFAAAGASNGHLHSSIREAPGPSWSASFPAQRSDRFIEQLWRKCPLPTPILTWCKQPGGAVFSPVAGSSGGCRVEKEKGHPLPSHPSKWR